MDWPTPFVPVNQYNIKNEDLQSFGIASLGTSYPPSSDLDIGLFESTFNCSTPAPSTAFNFNHIPKSSSVEVQFVPEATNNYSPNSISPSKFLANPTKPTHKADGNMPTPPRSESDLDELIYNVPELLHMKSRCYDDVDDVFNDLVVSSNDTIEEIFKGHSSGIPVASPSPPGGQAAFINRITKPIPRTIIQKDIMWSSAVECCFGASQSLNSAKPSGTKKRQYSECSDDLNMDPHYYEYMATPNISDVDSSYDQENLPETPLGSDSDGEEYLNPAKKFCPTYLTSTNVIGITNGHDYCSSVSRVTPTRVQIGNKSTSANQMSRGKSINGRSSKTQGSSPFMTPPNETASSEEEIIDVENTDGSYPILTSEPFKHIINITCQPVSGKLKSFKKPNSSEVKRKLQNFIQKSAPQKTNLSNASLAKSNDYPVSSSIKVRTPAPKRLGKPESYTKRMQSYHTENVLKSNKYKKKSRCETDEGKRSVHNSLERQRRVDLRNAFEVLRLLVPETKVLDKAPKVQILRKAAAYCHWSTNTEYRLLKEKEMHRLKNRELLISISNKSKSKPHQNIHFLN